MGAETNEMDTRDEDFHRNNHTLREWENEEIELSMTREITLTQDNEVVHHIDENKRNNFNTNLLICKSNYHKSLHRRIGHDFRSVT